MAACFRFKNLMVRTGEPDVAELMAQLAANAAEIAALKAEKEALSHHIVKLEEELALARLHRFDRHHRVPNPGWEGVSFAHHRLLRRNGHQ